ncbi:hypothetical protein LCGC14_2136530 [marine sediment metagenome]|uniref:Uncharacterized protein n=1 Tax=marine sediment metagenome TaxID=412755 RepID=A0A0F9GCW4_9ZZZZ
MLVIDLALVDKLGPSEGLIMHFWPCGCTLSYGVEEALRLARMGGPPQAGDYQPCGLHELPE